MSRMLTAEMIDRRGRKRFIWLDPALTSYASKLNRWIEFKSGMFWMGCGMAVFLIADVFDGFGPSVSIYELDEQYHTQPMIKTYNAALRAFKKAFVDRGPMIYEATVKKNGSVYHRYNFTGFLERLPDDVAAQREFERATHIKPWRDVQEELLCPIEFFGQSPSA